MSIFLNLSRLLASLRDLFMPSPSSPAQLSVTFRPPQTSVGKHHCHPSDLGCSPEAFVRGILCMELSPGDSTFLSSSSFCPLQLCIAPGACLPCPSFVPPRPWGSIAQVFGWQEGCWLPEMGKSPRFQLALVP